MRSEGIDVQEDRGTIAERRASIRPLSSYLDRETVAVIAEIKRSSPSKGAINPGIDSGEQARQYEMGGASAISVLTEPERFGGSDEDIRSAMSASSLPVLRKDFHVTELQLAHAAALGVSAALVIVRAVDPAALGALARAAKEMSLELLLEVRDEHELERALNLDARLIGVNNRNLETLEIDPSTVSRIIPLIPENCIAVAESGYASRESVAEASAAGADAVLVGSSISAAHDPAAAVAEIASVPRRGRPASA
jgi:indole-3-glycerol phosphate synthase